MDGRKKVRLVVNVRTFRCCRGTASIGWRTIDVIDVTFAAAQQHTREGQHRCRCRRQLAGSSLSPVMTNAELLPRDDIIPHSESNLPHPFHAAVMKQDCDYTLRPLPFAPTKARHAKVKQEPQNSITYQANRHQGVNVIIYTGQQASSR